MSVMYMSAHDAITFQLLEMSSIRTPNQKQFRIFTQVSFFKGFLGKISEILGSCIIKKINLEVTCKRNRFGYWNSCKRLPNFVDVAALLQTGDSSNINYEISTVNMISISQRVW